jgi:peptide/nickel transport system permease protein
MRPPSSAERNRKVTTYFGFVVLAGLAIMAIFAPLLAPCDPLEQSVNMLVSPSASHWLGTDEFGRDLLSRIIYAARPTFEVGVLAVVLGLIVGIGLGLLAGYYVGVGDRFIGAAFDVLLAVPTVLLGITLVTVLGRSIVTIGIAVALMNVPVFGRLVRSIVLSEKRRDYVEASRSLGASDFGLLFRHLLPATRDIVLVQVSVAMGNAVLIEAGLSFLGLGTQPPMPSWGGMLRDAQDYLEQAPGYAIFPGIAIALLVLGLNLSADGLRDLLDAHQEDRV